MNNLIQSELFAKIFDFCFLSFFIAIISVLFIEALKEIYVKIKGVQLSKICILFMNLICILVLTCIFFVYFYTLNFYIFLIIIAGYLTSWILSILCYKIIVKSFMLLLKAIIYKLKSISSYYEAQYINNELKIHKANSEINKLYLIKKSKIDEA